METAEQLIYFDKSGKLKTNSNGLRALSNIPDDYGIVSVSMVGDGRIGKSYLLNQIAGKNVFEVGSTTTRVTRGIWIYFRFDHTCKRAYMYCDVEGFGDPFKTNGTIEDERLLIIISQICDMIVFNIKGVYDAELLQKLELTCVLVKKYRKKNKVLSNPSLAVVLRDFNFDPQTSPDEELKQLFGAKPSIPKSFRSIKAFQLVKPAKRKQLRNLNSLPDSELKSDFVEERNRLKAYLMLEAKPLCSHTCKIISGEVLAKLIQETIEAVNSDKLGNIIQTLPDILHQNNQRCSEAAIESYEEELTSNWPSTSAPETLQTSLQTVKAKIRDDLQDKLVDFDDTVVEILQDFKAKTEAVFDRLSEAICEKELARVSSFFETNLGLNTYSVIGGHQMYLSDKRIVETAYQRLNNLGPRANSVWETYETELQPKEITIQQMECLLLRMQTTKKAKEDAEKLNIILGLALGAVTAGKYMLMKL